MTLTDINACICSYCNKYKSHISYDSRGKSICADCRRRNKLGSSNKSLKIIKI